MSPEQEARFLEEALGARRFYEGIDWASTAFHDEIVFGRCPKPDDFDIYKAAEDAVFTKYLAVDIEASTAGSGTCKMWFDDFGPEPLTRDERLLLLCK